MKQLILPHRLSSFWLTLLLGLPIASTVLVATQSNFQSSLEAATSRFWHQPAVPYRYRYFESAERMENPIARIEQEIALHQERLRQDSTSVLSQSSLATAYLQMARITGEGNWYLLAEQSAQRSLSSLPFGNSDALMLLARVAESKHDFTGALKLAAQEPGNKEAIGIQVTSNLAMGRLEIASQAVDQWVDILPSVSSLTLRALVKTAQGKDAEALQSFQDAIANEEPGELTGSARTRTLLGRFYYERGDLAQAEALYREALRIQPGLPIALLNLAQLKIRQGDYGAADRHYADIMATSRGTPRVFDSLILRGQARIQRLQGNDTQAQTLWSQAESLLRQTTGTEEAAAFGHRRDLARLLLERGNPQDIAAALPLMEAEVKIRRDAETLSTYAWALSANGKLQQAQQVIQEAIATGIRDANLYDRAAEINKALGNTAQAQTQAQKALEIDPQFGIASQNARNLAAGLGG
ncbi:MAG: tetratricopeptide repeat protein [Oscillatoriophycideae cyanobacterium NC_groundwater_1537_Pr4_S-0.65um_50_18]|nr:tetratricopeptide repeat protein [Oscillatoriophycideae cyanobacterium NC_groundwater_1537_Pr4_S-0.65um_50_18]